MLATVRRGPARHRHHVGEHTPREWLAQTVGVDGAALQAARRRKERRYPELVRRFGRARLLVLAVEVCGRWLKVTDEEAR